MKHETTTSATEDITETSSPLIGNQEPQKVSLNLDWGVEGDLLLGRTRELAVIQDALENVTSSSHQLEALIVYGQAGIGKTSLINAAIDSIDDNEGCFLLGCGKYGQAGASQPYGPVAAAVSQLCEQIMQNNACHEISVRLSAQIPPAELQILQATIPAVTYLIHEEDLRNSSEATTTSTATTTIFNNSSLPTLLVPASDTKPSDTASIRFHYIFRKLLGALASPKMPIVLFLDDLQWADEASRGLIDSLSRDSSLSNILFLGAVRTGEESTFSVTSDAMALKSIVCDKLSVDAVGTILGRALRLSQDAVEDLGPILHKRCDGNPLFLKLYVEILQLDGLIWYSQDTHRFEYDLAAIVTAVDIPVTVVELLRSLMENVDVITRMLLVLVALVGYPISRLAIHCGLYANDLAWILRRSISRKDCQDYVDCAQVDMSIRAAQRAGFLAETSSGTFRFVHDRMQQAALKLVHKASFSRLQSVLGCHLFEESKSNRSEPWMIFAAVNLLLKSNDSRIPLSYIGYVCFEASVKASSQAAFPAAAKYADSGIKVLGAAGWTRQYKLVLSLYNCSVEAHFSHGNFKYCMKRARTVQKHVQRIEDGIPTYKLLVRSNFIGQGWNECINLALGGLEKLGMVCLRNPGMIRLYCAFHRVQSLLKGQSLSDVWQSADECRDERISAILEMSNDAMLAGYWTREMVFNLHLCLKGIELSLQHGICRNSSYSLMLYAILISIVGNLKEGYACASCALQLAQKTGIDLPKTLDTFFIFFAHLKEIVAHSYKQWYLVKMKAIQIGDSYSIGASTFWSAASATAAGLSLWTLKGDFEQGWKLINEFEQTTFRDLYAPYLQFVFCLMKPEAEPATFAGDYFRDKGMSDLLLTRTTIPHQTMALILVADRCRTMFYYLVGNYFAVEENRRKLRRLYEKEVASCPDFPQIMHVVFLALNHLALCRQESRPFNRGRLKRYTRTLKKFDVFGHPTLSAVLVFITAEKLSLRKNVGVGNVVAKYEEAIEKLRTAKLSMLEAKAFERLGDFCALVGHMLVARTALEKAWKKYVEYGALCQRQHLLWYTTLVPDLHLPEAHAFESNTKIYPNATVT